MTFNCVEVEEKYVPSGSDGVGRKKHPVTAIIDNSPVDDKWRKIDGFTSGEEVYKRFRALGSGRLCSRSRLLKSGVHLTMRCDIEGGALYFKKSDSLEGLFTPFPESEEK